MRVLHLVFSFYRGGLESWLIAMLREIPRGECAMDACCMGTDTGPWAPLAQELGASVLPCPLRPTHIGYLRGLSKILREGEYDLIHNHLGVYSGFPIWVAHREKVPVVTTFHNTAFAGASMWWLRLPVLSHLRRAYGHFSIRYALRHTDLLTGVSKGVVSHLTKDRSDWQHRARVLYLGVGIPDLSTEPERKAFRRSLGTSESAPLIIHVGRFIEQKNHVGLIDIFGRIVDHRSDAKLLLVGEGPLQSSIETLVANRGLEDSVLFLGFRNDVPQLMSTCDLLLLPSLHEGLPIVCLEAQAAGLPVVASRIPGLVEAVEEGRTAFLHDISDHQGMADSILRILNNQAMAGAMREAGRDRIVGFFSRKAAAARLLDLYSECLSIGDRTFS